MSLAPLGVPPAWRAALLAAALLGLVPVPAMAGSPWDWCNAINRQLGMGWGDGYHARNRGVGCAEQGTYPDAGYGTALGYFPVRNPAPTPAPTPEPVPAPAPTPVPPKRVITPAPAQQPPMPVSEPMTSAANPAPPATIPTRPTGWSPIFSLFHSQPAAAEHYPTTKDPPILVRRAPAPQPAIAQQPIYRQAALPAPAPPVAPPAITRDPPATSGGFYPEEMPGR